MSATTAYIERGSPWENGYIESFNARLRDELLCFINFGQPPVAKGRQPRSLTPEYMRQWVAIDHWARSKARYAINGGIRLSDAMGRPLHAPNHELPNEASPVTL